jgi:hypothetical protein
MPEKRRRKRLRLFLLWMLVPLILLPVLTIAGYLVFAQQYQRDKTLGVAAEDHLHTAVSLFGVWSRRPFDLNPVRQAGQNFQTSSLLLAQVSTDLHWLPALANQLPDVGARLSAADNLVGAAQGISQAGMAGCQLLETFLPVFTNPLSTHGQGLGMVQINTLNRLFPQVRAGLLEALTNVGQLQPGDLRFDPHLAQTFAGVQHDLPLASAVLADFSALVPVLPTLLGVGHPANYLLEVLDSSELRPGGGFIGNDGLLTLSNGRFTGAHIQDVLLLDKNVKDGRQYIPWPPAYQWLSRYLHVPSWSLRDSNLDADFPTDARNGEENYDREGGPALVQGVIAVTPALIQNALAITGPIFMPEYDETVTSANLIDLIHYHQLGAGQEGNSSQLTADGQTSLRKHFTELLAEHFMTDLHHISSAELGKFLNLFANSLESKDIQVYFNHPAAEQLLEEFHIASTIQAPAGDSLFVVDANTAGNKADAFIVNTMQDQVELDGTGDAVHHLTLSYAWIEPGRIYGTGFYRDYARIYVPPGSVLVQQQGWQPLGTESAFGRTVWSGQFRMHYGETVTIHLVWRVPHVATRASGQTAWQYRYLLQRQAGTHWISSVQINLATCRFTSVVASGQRIVHPQEAAWSEALQKDTTLGANYSCTE